MKSSKSRPDCLNTFAHVWHSLPCTMITGQLATAQLAANVVGSSGEQVNSHSSGSHCPGRQFRSVWSRSQASHADSSWTALSERAFDADCASATLLVIGAANRCQSRTLDCSPHRLVRRMEVDRHRSRRDVAQQRLDDISRCSGFEPSGCRGVAEHVWAHGESHCFREPLTELLRVVVTEGFAQRRLVQVDEDEVTGVAFGCP